MKSLWRWMLRGCLLLAVTVLIVAMTGAGQSFPGAADASKPAGEKDASARDGLICIAHGTADVRDGVRSLYPVQSGRVVEVLVKEGEPVKQGAPLLRLDAEAANLLAQRAQAAVDEAEATLGKAQKSLTHHALLKETQKQAIRAAEAKLAAAQANLDRAQENYKAGVGNRSGLEVKASESLVAEARAAVRVQELTLKQLDEHDPTLDVSRAEAALRGAKAELARAKKAERECELLAPESGTVVRILTGKGEVLGPQPKQPALLFCADGDRIIRAEVEQEFAARVRKDIEVDIEDDIRKTLQWKGKVDHVPDFYLQRRSHVPELFAFNESRILECIIRIERKPGQDMPRLGQRVRVHIMEKKP